MGSLGAAAEWHRLAERYRAMSDDELITLAQRPTELTDAAQQILVGEISLRKLKVPPPSHNDRIADRVPPHATSEDDPYAEDRELVEIVTVWSLSDARRVEALLEAAHIPFFIGPERATRADAVTSNFANGLSVQVMSIGLPWARSAMQDYQPVDEPPGEQFSYEENAELAVRCPRCHSTEVVLDELVDQATDSARSSPAKYKWVCDACGHEWEDEGIQTKG